MAKVLPDYEIERLMGKCIAGAELDQIHPNGIELRLGDSVYFYFSNKRAELGKGQFLTVRPGEQVLFTVKEKIDFTQEMVDQVFPSGELGPEEIGRVGNEDALPSGKFTSDLGTSRKQLMAFLTPRTSEIRDGSFQATTKVDSGFRGSLVWSLRNSSNEELNIEYGQPILKMTIFLLEGDEVPGDLSKVKFMDEADIAFSKKQLRIPENLKVGSDYENNEDFLQSMGGPFKYLADKFSSLEEEVDKKIDHLEKKMDGIGDKIGELEKHMDRRFDDTRKNIEDRFDKLEVSLEKSLDLRIIIRFVWMVSGFYLAIRLIDYFKFLPAESREGVYLLFAVAALVFTWIYLKTRRVPSVKNTKPSN